MLSRLFSRRNRQVEPARHSAITEMEGLEGRLLMKAPAKIAGAVLGNRGEVTITLTRTVTGISKSSVKLFTPGANGQIGDADDIRAPAQVIYNPESFKVTIKGKLPANTGYRIRLDAKIIKALDGRKLDGEFTGSFPTGNGVTGGNFALMARTPTNRVRMSTSDGVMTLRMRPDVAPTHVANFLSYTNTGRYDNTFFTRSENNPQPFVIQGGSLQITGTGSLASEIIATDRDPAVLDENDRADALSNIFGTIAFAKGGPDDATNQFFINLNDNSFLDSPSRPDGGFTVFAEVSKGIGAAQAINQKPTANLSSQIGTVAASSNTGVSNVPVNNEAQAEAALNPFRDLSYIRRVEVMCENEVVPG